MRFSLRFQFRTPGKNPDGTFQTPKEPRSLYIRFTLNGQQADPYASGEKVDSGQWDQKGQRVIGRSKLAESINDRLRDIIAEHKDHMNLLIRQGTTPTAESVKRAWLKRGKTVPKAVELFQLYVNHLRSLQGTDEGWSKHTLQLREIGMGHLQQFISSSGGRQDIELSELSIAWARDFHRWLMKTSFPGKAKKKQNSTTAAKYISYFQDALDYAIELKWLEVNPLDKLKFKAQKLKPVYFLEDSHLAKLWSLELYGDPDLARDWSLLACYTGMDFPDLQAFLADPSKYLFATPSGKEKIIIYRNKPPHGECQIPVLPQVKTILDKYDWKVPKITSRKINEFWYVFENQIRFQGGRVTLKILRKTAGSLFLNEGYSLEVVQKILGHNRISTTQGHYTRLLDKRVDNEMDKVGIEF